jgi:ABC-2 type transport system permease protein
MSEAKRLGPLRRETLKLLAQKRSYIGAGLLALTPALFALGTYLSANPHGGDAEGNVFMMLAGRNGLYIPLATVGMLSVVMLPLAAAMVGGFLVAGEAEQGTLRMVLLRPVRRGSMLLAKWTVGMLYLGVVLILISVVGLIAGAAFFGLEPMSGPFLPEMSIAEALLWMVVADLIALVYLGCVMSLALLISVISESSLTSAIVAFVLILVVQILLLFDYFAALRPYWFTTHADAWMGLFKDPIDWAMIGDGLLAFAAYTLVPLAAAWYVFRKKDILS